MAVLKIYGAIGEQTPIDEMFTGEMISAKKVSEFLDETTDSEITVKINSPGGDVQEGWAIHDLLVSSGKKIKTIGEGKVYSIATIVFLAGTEREMMKNADGLIHNPYIHPYTLGGSYESDDLIKIAEELQQEEEKILDFYVEKTGADRDRIAELMKKDTKLSAEDMVELGFATKIIEPVVAYAYYKPKLNRMDEKAFFEKLGNTLDKAITKITNFSRLPATDQVMKDKNGNEFTLEKESGSPAVGDKASPDGTYEMENGDTITIADGVVTSITEAVAEKTELELAQERIAELEAKVAEADTAKAEAEQSKEEYELAKAECGKDQAEAKALYEELAAIRNEWKPNGRVKFGTVDKVGNIDLNEVRKLREKITNKTN